MSNLLLPGDWVYDPEANIVGVIRTVSNGFAYVWQRRGPMSTKVHESIPLYLSEELVHAHGHMYENADAIPYLAQRRKLLYARKNTNRVVELDDEIKRRYGRYL